MNRSQADQGYVYAQYNLGVMYDKAQGVPQNYAEALKWYRLAADQGYVYGQGGPQDFVRAHMWFNLSAAQGNQDAARSRDDIATLMTPAQIAEAQKLAREWQPKRP
jgi:TPR repeat protein